MSRMQHYTHSKPRKTREFYHSAFWNQLVLLFLTGELQSEDVELLRRGDYELPQEDQREMDCVLVSQLQ